MRCASLAAVLLPALLLAQTKPAPPPLSMNFKALDAGKVSLDAWRGKVVAILVFKSADAGMNDTFTRFKSEAYAVAGVEGAAICVGTDKSEVQAKVKETGFPFPILFDEKTGAAPLAKRLGVRMYPWCILLDPDGRIASQFPLPQLPAGLQKQLELTPPRAVSKATLSLGNEKLTLAEGMLTAENYWAAARYLSQLPDDAKQDPTIGERVSAATLLLDRAADALIAETEKQITDGKLGEAIFKLAQLGKALKDSPVAAKVDDQLHSVTDDPDLKSKAEKQISPIAAADLLEQATDYDAQISRAKAYVMLEEVAKTYPATPAAAQAKALRAKWETDPAERRKLRDALYGDKANALLSRADNLSHSSFKEKSKPLSEQVVHDFPYTTAAEKAAAILKDWK